jgi:hypothetical protein
MNSSREKEKENKNTEYIIHNIKVSLLFVFMIHNKFSYKIPTLEICILIDYLTLIQTFYLTILIWSSYLSSMTIFCNVIIIN